MIKSVEFKFNVKKDSRYKRVWQPVSGAGSQAGSRKAWVLYEKSVPMESQQYRVEIEGSSDTKDCCVELCYYCFSEKLKLSNVEFG